jgi:hypothetical protein
MIHRMIMKGIQGRIWKVQPYFKTPSGYSPADSITSARVAGSPIVTAIHKTHINYCH